MTVAERKTHRPVGRTFPWWGDAPDRAVRDVQATPRLSFNRLRSFGHEHIE